jgi:diacylglycerol kinase (ATP)
VARARAELAVAIVEQQSETADVLVTTRTGHARDLTTAAVARGARLVIAWGGDGTINEVASALAFGNVPLGIIPAGSGNGLATELGVSTRPERAIANAVRASPASMDVGEIGGRLFINVAGIGLDAHVARQFNRPGNHRRGFVRDLRIGARALIDYVPAWYTISTADVQMTVRAVLVVVANSVQYGNGARIAPGAQIDDGALDLVVVEERSRLATFFQAPRLFNGSVNRMPGCSIRRIQEVTIESSSAMVFHVDGEPVEGGARLTARIHPQALKICVA